MTYTFYKKFPLSGAGFPSTKGQFALQGEKSQDSSLSRADCPFVLGNPAPGRGEFCKFYMAHVLWMLPWTLLLGKSPSPSVFSLLINLALQQV